MPWCPEFHLIDILTIIGSPGGSYFDVEDSMRLKSSPASFCASAICLEVIRFLSESLPSAALVFPCAAARFNQT